MGHKSTQFHVVESMAAAHVTSGPGPGPASNTSFPTYLSLHLDKPLPLSEWWTHLQTSHGHPSSRMAPASWVADHDADYISSPFLFPPLHDPRPGCLHARRRGRLLASSLLGTVWQESSDERQSNWAGC